MFRLRLFLVALFVPAVLLCDGAGMPRQLALSAATLGVLVLYVRAARMSSLHVALAIAIATLGELVLSVGWGLYVYRETLLPFYVPFGHGLFYALAADTASQRFATRHAESIKRWVLIGGTALAIFTLIRLGDTWGALWWAGAAVLMIRARTGALLPICFVYTMLLEWLGTALGNWTWAAVVPFVGLRAANPPSGVGILYVILDLLTVAAAAALVRPRSAPEPVLS